MRKTESIRGGGEGLSFFSPGHYDAGRGSCLGIAGLGDRMHTVTIVLVPLPVSDLREAVRQRLAIHRLDEEQADRAWRLDYWTVGQEQIGDAESAAVCGVGADPDLAGNVCLVPRLPAQFLPGAIVTPEGRWHDLCDFGWKPVNGDSRPNRESYAQWVRHVRELLAANANCVAVEVDAHS